LKPCSQQSSPFKPSEIYHSYFKLVISKIQWACLISDLLNYKEENVK
jgi:hypothetical protein